MLRYLDFEKLALALSKIEQTGQHFFKDLSAMVVKPPDNAMQGINRTMNVNLSDMRDGNILKNKSASRFQTRSVSPAATAPVSAVIKP